MGELRVDLDGERTVFRPGERIRGTASWRLDEPPEEFELRLFWFTEGKGDQDVGVVETQALGAAGTFGELEFDFTAPEAPLSFSGQLITLIWAVELVANPGGLAGRRNLVIAYGDREIDIRADPPEVP